MIESSLSGFTVLDCSQGIATSLCACELAELGARVLKIEPPQGDWARSLGVRQGESSVIFDFFNRGKHGIVLDLKDTAGREALMRLAEGADVFIESNRPGVMSRLGLAYEDLQARNPGLVYVSVTGYGQTGPYMDRPGTDTVMQAFTGFAYGASGSKAPVRVHLALVDVSTGLYACQAVLAALLQRSRNGKGQYLEISLMHAFAALQNYKIAEDAFLDGEKHAEVFAGAGIYRTADGYLAVSAMRDRHVTELLDVTGCSELLKDPRFSSSELRHKNRDGLRDAIATEICVKPTSYWLEVMTAKDLLCQAVLSYGDFVKNEQVQHEEIFRFLTVGEAALMPVARLPGTSRHARLLDAAPWVGQHTQEVLSDAGFSANEVATVLRSGEK
ncbi:CaiB/BaiF CoA transferase family protein [Achromobacter aegrifaciens]